MAKEITEDGGEVLAFGEVIKPSLEHVLNVVWVGRDGVSEDMDVNGACRREPQQVRVPVTEIVKLRRPRRRRVGSAHVAAAPWARPQDLQR